MRTDDFHLSAAIFRILQFHCQKYAWANIPQGSIEESARVLGGSEDKTGAEPGLSEPGRSRSDEPGNDQHFPANGRVPLLLASYTLSTRRPLRLSSPVGYCPVRISYGLKLN